MNTNTILNKNQRYYPRDTIKTSAERYIDFISRYFKEKYSEYDPFISGPLFPIFPAYQILIDEDEKLETFLKSVAQLESEIIYTENKLLIKKECEWILHSFLEYKTVYKTHLCVEDWESPDNLPSLVLIELYTINRITAFKYGYRMDKKFQDNLDAYSSKIYKLFHGKFFEGLLTSHCVDDCVFI